MDGTSLLIGRHRWNIHVGFRAGAALIRAEPMSAAGRMRLN